MGVTMRSTLFSLLFVFSLPALADNIRLIPSNAKVKSVILSYLPAVLPASIANPRLLLIKEVRKAFPHLDVKVATDIPIDELWKVDGELKSIINDVVYLGSGNHNEIQDPFEFAWDYDRNRQVIFSFPGYPGFRPVTSFWKDAEVIPVPGSMKPPAPIPGSEAGRIAGGNVAVLPDATPVLGNDAPKDSIDFFKRVSPAGQVLLVDTAWTGSGDVDEVFLWTKDPTGKASCILFQLDVLAGSGLITADTIEQYKQELIADARQFTKALGYDVSEDYFTNPKTQWDRKLAESVRKSFDDGYSQLTKGQAGIADIQKRIDASRNTLMATSGMAGCRTVPLPVIYNTRHDDCTGASCKYTMLFENPVNSMVIEDQVFSLEPPFAPEKNAIERIFQDNGFNVHWFSATGFNEAGGNMHCNTKLVREP